MKDPYQEAVNRRTRDHAWLCQKKTMAARAKIGTTGICGHEIVGYESKKSGLLGAYCFINQATSKRQTPDGVEDVERAQIQFMDHSQDPFWVDLANIIRKG